MLDGEAKKVRFGLDLFMIMNKAFIIKLHKIRLATVTEHSSHKSHTRTMNLGVTHTSPAQTAAYLRTLPAIRERCSRVHGLASKGKLEYFDYHPEKEADVSKFCIGIMKVSRIPFIAVILA